MHRPNLLLTAAVLTLLAGVALLYLNLDPRADQASTEKLSPVDHLRLHADSIVRADQIEDKKSNYVPQEIHPEDFTTAPKPHSVEGRLLRVFADRQLPDAEKVERFLGLIPSLSDKGKKIALDYATQLITDQDYLRQRPRLLRLAITDDLREVVMLDILTRDDGIKMPSLVELMKSPSEITRHEAREILEAFLDRDYGTDPHQWDAPVRQWVAENQDI
jgi:hypothetical protein